MKIKKSTAFLIVHLTLTAMFFFIAIFEAEYLIGVGVPILAGLITNVTQFVINQVRDAEKKAKNYRWELDENMTTAYTKKGVMMNTNQYVSGYQVSEKLEKMSEINPDTAGEINPIMEGE